MKPLRVLIVDDERPARRRLRRLLSEHRAVEIVGEAGDGTSAIDEINARRPDVVLLDVQMPELSGIDVVTRLERPRPCIIFVTAHDAYAVRAFELHALDYLLKPVSRLRLADAIDRVRRLCAVSRSGLKVDPRIDAWVEWTGEARVTRLPVASAGRVDLVSVASIDWIEAADNYLVLHCGARRHILRETMARLAGRLDPARFARIHRSTIVQVDQVDRLAPLARGDWSIVLRDGTRLTMSRTYRKEVQARHLSISRFL